MGMNRKRKFGVSSEKKISPDLIDTSEALLKFAIDSSIETCPLDVEEVARRFGISIISDSSFHEEISGTLEKDENDKWTIRVNANHHPNRRRYTIAHELGHYCLHRHQKDSFKDQIFFRGLERSRMEWQANTFAGEILMPEEQFRLFLQDGIHDIDELARKFQVSSLALRIRASELGFQVSD